jgi:hypothetical protein
MADENLPPRVLAAERRREFRELLTRSSLGCDCGHMLSEHAADDWTSAGDPINPSCWCGSAECEGAS